MNQTLEPSEETVNEIMWLFAIPQTPCQLVIESALQHLRDLYQYEYHIELEAELVTQNSSKSQHCICITLNKEDADICLDWNNIQAILGFELKPRFAQ